MAKLIDQNIVVLGSLNPAILHPNWLAKIGLLESGKKVEAKIKVGTYFPSEYRGEKFSWLVDYSRLQVSLVEPSNKDFTKSLSEFVHKIFDELNHTPVTGLGENFVFEVKDSPSSQLFLEKKDWNLGKKVKWGEISLLQHDLKFDTDSKSNITINVIQEKQGLQVKFNFHYDIDNTENLKDLSGKMESNLVKAEKILEEIY